jgi:hypothetical protein
MLRRTLASSRYIVFIAVVATLLASVALILYEAIVVAQVVIDAVRGAGFYRLAARPSPSPPASPGPKSHNHCAEVLGRSTESKIIFDHSGRPNRDLARIRSIKFAEHDLVAPDLTKEVLEDLNR